MRRIFFISFVLTIIVIVLCGCNLQKNTNNTVDNSKPQITEKSIATDNLAVVHFGIALNRIDFRVEFESLADDQQSQNILKKYEKEYYLYSNNKLIGKARGKVEESGLDSFWQVIFPPDTGKYEVAISESYNPYPRYIVYTTSNFQQEFSNSSNIITEINNKFNVNCCIKELANVDLDGDEKNEYIALFVEEKSYFFTKCLIDTQYNIISYLTVFKENCIDFLGTVDDYNLQNGSEIVDVNNDGIMEVIVDMPSYEGTLFHVFTYNNGKFDGDFINKVSFQP